MRARSRGLAFVLMFFSVIMLSTVGNAQPVDFDEGVSLSTPSTVGPNETISIVVEATPEDPVKGNVTVFNETKTVRTFQYGPGTGVEEYTFSSGTLKGGVYNVSVHLENSSADISLTAEGAFMVSRAADIRPFELTAYAVKAGSCPLQGSAYGHCKQFAINMTGTRTTESDALVRLSESGTVYTGQVTNRTGSTYYVRVVDPDTAGVYDTVFVDDDTSFREQQETGAPEKSFLSRWDTVFTVNTTGGTGQLQVFDIGTDHVYLTVPVLDSEYPIRPGADVGFGVMATADGTPVPSYTIDATLTDLDTGATTDVSPTPPDTNAVGVTNISEITDIEAGTYRLSINDEYSTVFDVKQFDISYRITSTSTGTQKRTFKPGDRIEIEAYPTQGGQRITADSIDISVVLPDGRVLDVSREPFTLPQNASAGTATVQIEVTVNGVTQSASARLDIKRFKVLTVPLRKGTYGPRMTENFAPNATMYLFTSAVKLGTAGGIDDIIHAEFYALDDSDTGVDECSNSTAMLPGQIGDDTVTPVVVNASSLRNSSLFADIRAEMPAGMQNQCVLELWTPSQSGFFRGTVQVERLAANDTETGSFSISTSRISVDGSPYSFTDGRWDWSFGPNETMAVRPRVNLLRTHTDVPGVNLTGGHVLELQGPGDSTPRNVSFMNASEGGPLIVFNAPETAGHYRAKFTVSANVTNSSGMITEETAVGRAFFEVELFDIQADTKRYRHGPTDTVHITATVTTPQGIAKEGATVSVVDIRNEETETDYTNKTSYNKNLTNADGVTKLQITPDSSWGEGWYRVKLKVSDTSGKTDTARTYFRVQEYRTRMTRKVNGDSCRYGCDIVSGDNITFDPRVYSYADDSYVSNTVNVSRSTLIYRGGRRSRVRQEIPLENVTIDSGNGAVTVSTGTLSTGYYSLNLHLGVDGNTEIADEYFRIGAFSMAVDRVSDQWQFGPGQNVTYNISFDRTQDTTVELTELYNYEDGSRHAYNLTKTQYGEGTRIFNDTKHALFNVTVPQNANEDYHSGKLAVTVDGQTQEEYISFDVKTLFAGAPKTLDGDFSTTFTDETSLIQADEARKILTLWSTDIGDEFKECTSLLSGHEYNFSGTLGNGSECWTDETDAGARKTPLYGLMVDNTSLYLSDDRAFNESSDLANGLRLNETFIDVTGIERALNNIQQSGDSLFADLEAVNYTRHGRCDRVARAWGLTWSGAPTDDNCWAAINKTFTTSSAFDDIEGTYNVIVNRNHSTAYISDDAIIDDADDLLQNKSNGSVTAADALGLTWRVEDIDANESSLSQHDLRLNATNGFETGVLVNTSTADAFNGDWTGPVAFPEDGWEVEMDLNRDGDRNDTLYAIAENNSGSLDTVRLSYDNNFSLNGSHVLALSEKQGGQVNGSGEHLYLGTFHQGSFGREAGIHIPSASGFWSPDDKRPLTNYTFPVRVRYPNGTAVNGATVKIDHITREYAGTVERLSAPVRSTTDAQGMAFLTINLSAGPNASTHLGHYEIIPAVNTSNTAGFKVLDDGPSPRVRLVDTDTESYLSFTAHLDAYDNMTKSGVESTTGLSDLPDGENNSYRIRTGLMEDALGNDCIDVDNDETCGEETHIVMWEESDFEENPAGAAVDSLAIDDDTNFSVDDETGTEYPGEPGVEAPFRNEEENLFSGISSLDEFDRPGFATFDESTDNASVYWERDHDFPATEAVTIGIEAEELHGGAQITGATVQLTEVRFNGDAYPVSGTINASTNSHGRTLLAVAPQDIDGYNNSVWPMDETLEVIGNISTTGGTQRFETWVSTGEQ